MNSKLYYSINDIQSNSNMPEVDIFRNSFQTNRGEKSPINIKKNQRHLTPLKLNLKYKAPQKSILMKKDQNFDEPLDAVYKYIINKNGLLKEANGKRFFKKESESINSQSNICKNDRKRRSNSVRSISLNMFFLIQNLIPITAKVINLPKNLNLKKIYNRINARIDDRTFLRLKYNKKLGILYIKFRNEIYYNFYSCLFKDRSYFRIGKYLEMKIIKENESLWTQNSDEFILNFHFENSNPKDFIYKSYIEKNFRLSSYSRLKHYFNNF